MTDKCGLLILLGSLLLTSCKTIVQKPCQAGGQPAREIIFKGTHQCEQKKDQYGKYVNHGRYVEWYPDGSVALEGEYREGLKDGKWTEYDQAGKRISEKWFDKGKEVPSRTAHAPK